MIGIDSSNQPPTQNGNTANTRASPPEASQPTPSDISQPPPQRRQRGAIKSRFKGFDSDDEEDNKQQLSSIPLAESQISSARRGRRSQYDTQGADSANSNSDATQRANSRKRPAPDSAEEEGGEEQSNIVDRLIPAATAVKRRRIEEAEQARERGIAPSTAIIKEEASKQSTRKAPKREVDIKKKLRERREKEDETARRDAENLHDTLDDADIEGLRNLAVVEEMEVAPRNPPRRGARQANGTDQRWDDRWNGRKNYKKFVRQGEGGHRPRKGGQSVIVPLEEVRKKDFGIGHNHWHESGEKEKNLKRKRPHGQEDSGLQSQSQDVGRSLARPVEEEEEEDDDDDDDDMLDVMEVAGPPARRTRGKETQQSASAISQRGTTGVKKAAENGRGRVGLRKQTVFEARDSDSESEDELKFRFGKRRRV